MSLQTAFRRAQLSARRTLEAAQREERRLLLLPYTAETPSTGASPIQSRRRNQMSRDPSSQDKEVNASSDVTAALRRTHDMMASELSRSQFAHDTLKESTAALAQLGETYSTLDTLLSSSKNLLGTLLRSQKSDTWYLETAFYILLVTIAWLIWRRLLYGPTWWLVWFPMKIVLRTSTSLLTAAGVIGGASNIEAVSSSITTQSSVVHNSATGKLSAPAGGNGPPAPSIRVGGGGRGAPMSGPNIPPEQTYAPPGTISEKVGQMIDGSRDGTRQYHEEDSQEEEPRNPKKRMWEEEVAVEKETRRSRDEL
ncbi:Sec20-domain-containing protein [Amylocarpus encephaloides]|uniref:Sec20-domain-containing protein n=1 Tax=Amylocarpus encephaloides TaxID=45428 RepID=A0A9P7YKY3_9HELO|nr:Sec20-domain-containing protein [Amylocarpus encephaloides]